MRRAVLGAALAAATSAALALDTPAWPPPPGVEVRMRELQLIIGSKDATPEQREAARSELAALLKSPAGQGHRARDERPPRAAIEPLPPIVKPAANPAVPAPPIAHLEVVEPPKVPVISGHGPALPQPSGRIAIDPRTGAVLHEVPGGYVDPRTGQFSPR